MTEFWEENFRENKTMWGFIPSDSAIMVKDFFLKNNVRNILIPGVGYGRNAKAFIDNGIKVTGIEISETAIKLAKENGINIKIYNGSVTDMPFDNELYDGIFCYALIHLLDEEARKKFIKDCYNQLKPNGYMIFVTVSKKDLFFKIGKPIGKDLVEITEGLNMFFYDADSIREDFGDYGLEEFIEIDDPKKSISNKRSIKFTMIKCKK